MKTIEFLRNNFIPIAKEEAQGFTDVIESLESIDYYLSTISNQVEPVVKPACEFTDKQLDIISLAVEKWLIEDTFINYNGKHGQHFIDKINGNPTLKDRLLELSKSV